MHAYSTYSVDVYASSIYPIKKLLLREKLSLANVESFLFLKIKTSKVP